jgi:hypothetical protein
MTNKFFSYQTAQDIQTNRCMHTTESVVTIPYTFQQEGTYVINITVYGFLFNPITPETTQFPISVN